jgi:hypothetical protein
MRGSEASADLVGCVQSLVGRQTADAAQQGRKVLTVDVLHSEEVLAVDLTDVVDAAHIRMRNLAGVTHFSVKRGESRCIILERGGKKLEGYNVAKFEILCAIDFTHAAAPQQSHDPIPVGEDSAWSETLSSWRVRTCRNRCRHDSGSIWLQGRRIGIG